MTRLAHIALLSLGIASAAGAQGYSYDIASSGSDPRSGETRVMARSHGRFANGVTRVDIVESPAPNGMMGVGTYMVSNATSGLVNYVDPIKRQYYQMDTKEMAAEATTLQNAMSGMAKMEFVDVHVDLQDLGAGEAIEGYATLKYRVVQSYTMRVSILGRNMDTKTQSVSNVWVAPQLTYNLNPGSRPTSSSTGMMHELTDQLAKAYANVKPGVMLRMIDSTSSGAGARARTQVHTMAMSNFKREAFDASVFQVPAGFARIDSPFEAMAKAGRKP